MRKRAKAGFSLIELLMVVAVLLIIAAIALPSFLHARMAANQSSAAASLRAINIACATYAATYNTFPDTLAKLGPAVVPSPSAADLLQPDLASGTKSGYAFSYTLGAVDSSGNIRTYAITADPITRGTTGQPGFFTDSSFVIHVNVTGTASASDPALN